MAKSVYLLEDDKSICELVQCALEMAGISLHAYTTVAAFEAALRSAPPAVALLDIMLPDGNGLDVLTKIRNAYPQVRCIMLSALGQETDKVRGLNLGADDYIAKPFGVLELTALVNAALRRQNESEKLTYGDLLLDEERRAVLCRGEALELNNKEFQLLQYMVRNRGKVLSRENILTAVWGYEEGETRTVDNHVARLRKLGVTQIETVFGVGYKLP